MSDTQASARAVADRLVDAYAIPHHPTAVAALDNYLAEHPHEGLLVMWHHLARKIADIYSVAQLRVEPPEPADLSGTNPADVADSHARQLVVLCQQHNLDAEPAIAEYAQTRGEDLELRKWITLALANRLGEADRE